MTVGRFIERLQARDEFAEIEFSFLDNTHVFRKGKNVPLITESIGNGFTPGEDKVSVLIVQDSSKEEFVPKGRKHWATRGSGVARVDGGQVRAYSGQPLVDELNGYERDLAWYEGNIKRLKNLWVGYTKYLQEKYPAAEGEEWDFTCRYHQQIDDLIKKFPGEGKLSGTDADGRANS